MSKYRTAVQELLADRALFQENQTELRTGLLFLGQLKGHQNAGLDGVVCESDLHFHPQIKEALQFTTLVSIAKANLISCICFKTILEANFLTSKERNLEIVQLDIFKVKQKGFLRKKEKLPYFP